MPSRNTMPDTYDVTFIAEQAGIEANNYGHAPDGEGGIVIVTNGDNYEAIQAAIDAYPKAYCERMLPMRRSEAEARAQQVFQGGFTPSTGPLAGHTLQVRSVEDRTNWLTSQAAYSAAVAAGQGDVAGATFRTTENETVVCTFAEGLQTLLDMAAWGAAIMQTSWALKDEMAQAADIDALAAIDVDAAPWPS